MTQSAIPLSGSPVDKLQACLNHGRPEHDRHFPPGYVSSCKRWFEALSPAARETASAVIAAHGRGNEISAMEIAAALPAAPKLPLRED